MTDYGELILETVKTRDGETKLIVQTRADGSRTVLLFTAQTIDATGQPIR